jgi:hypothetical protein
MQWARPAILSIAHSRALEQYWAPKISVWIESTYFAGLRKAGMPEE